MTTTNDDFVCVCVCVCRCRCVCVFVYVQLYMYISIGRSDGYTYTYMYYTEASARFPGCLAVSLLGCQSVCVCFCLSSIATPSLLFAVSLSGHAISVWYFLCLSVCLSVCQFICLSVSPGRWDVQHTRPT